MFLGGLSFGKSLEEGCCVGWEVLCFALRVLVGLSFVGGVVFGCCAGWELESLFLVLLGELCVGRALDLRLSGDFSVKQIKKKKHI